jgi:hypothetical protein
VTGRVEATAGTGSAQVVPVASGSAADLAAAAGKIALLADDGTDMQTLGDNAKTAGAVAVLVYEKTPGVFDNGGISLGSPVFQITLDDAAKLLAAAAKSSDKLAWTSIPDSPYLYNLAFHRAEQLALQRVDGRPAALQPEATSYTLKLHQQRVRGPGAAIWQRSTGVETDFTFSSHLDTGAYPQSLPLLFSGFGVAVDGGDDVAAGPQRITLSATGQSGYTPGAITSAHLAYSLDGGTTWTDAPTTQADGQWSAEIDHSADSGKTVSLRLSLGAADGASVTQTVTSAYGVR